MDTYKFSISVPANDKPDAEVKMKALATLASRLNAKELAKLAHVVVNDPIKTRMAKAALGL